MNILKTVLALLQNLFSKNVATAIKVSQFSEIVRELEGTKIVLDPGHGGKRGRRDPGAVGHLDSEEVYERDVVLEICKKLAFKLDELGAEVILTRIDNDLEARSTLGAKVRIANAEDPDIFISIHANANSGRPAQGIETFYNKGRTESKDLARKIQANLVETFSTHKDRGIKDGSNLYVLKNATTKAKCLVECEFINHPEQVKFLVRNPEGIANAILAGIKEYIKI